MKAISVRQPWAWAICHAGKDIENREQFWGYRGPIAIHASKGCTREEWEDGAYDIDKTLGREQTPPPPLCDLPRGSIVGMAELVACVMASRSPWFVGRYGLVLANVRPLEVPVLCGGELGLWTVPPDVEARVLGALR